MNNFEMDETQEQIDFVPEHKKNTVYQNFFVSVDKEMVANIEKTSTVVCLAMDKEAANLIRYAAKHINEYNINNYSQLIKDAMEYFLAENYHEVYSNYIDFKEKIVGEVKININPTDK